MSKTHHHCILTNHRSEIAPIYCRKCDMWVDGAVYIPYLPFILGIVTGCVLGLMVVMVLQEWLI